MTAIADHIWQSTLFVILAAGLAWALKGAPPKFRYAIWLAASVKFLVPISLLVALGGYFTVETSAPIARPEVASVASSVAQPFSQRDLPVAALALSSSPSASPAPARLDMIRLPLILGAIWMTGVAALLVVRVRHWSQITAALRGSSELVSGRELDLLRTTERSLGVRRPTRLLASPSALEPAAVGLVRPVLLWPTVLTARLSDAEMTAIFAHELTHLRRCDNQTGFLHVVVETVFWFHPMVWWLSSRLVEERERACDQSVLAAGAEPRTYAEGLLTVCRHCLESPVRYASGVTGSGLTRRVERIMSADLPRKLRFVERSLLILTTFVAIMVPVAAGVLRPAAAPNEFPLGAFVEPVTAIHEALAPPLGMRPAATPSDIQPDPPRLLQQRSGFIGWGDLPLNSVTALSTPQAAPPLPADPDSPKIARGDTVRIEHGPARAWTMSAKADGEANLPGIGAVTFEGLTAKQVEYLVRQRLSANQMITPTSLITVTIDPQQTASSATMPSELVFVVGPVRTPGQLSLRGTYMTLMRAVNAAGGWAADAGSEVLVLRPPASASPVPTSPDNPNVQVTRYARKDLLENRIDPPIQAGDTIWVAMAEPVWITGEIMSYGQKIWEPGMTVGNAIALAGGTTERGSVARSYIQRRMNAPSNPAVRTRNGVEATLSNGTFRKINDLRLDTPILARDTLVIERKLF